MTFAPRRTDAGVGRERAGQKVDQRGLARAVGADDADPVAAHDPHRKIAHDCAIAIGLADPLGVDHQRARRFGVLRDHGATPTDRSASRRSLLRSASSPTRRMLRLRRAVTP